MSITPLSPLDAIQLLSGPAELEQLRSSVEQAGYGLTPSALIRQWVTERAEATDEETDLVTAVATLRRDVERVASLVRPA